MPERDEDEIRVCGMQDNESQKRKRKGACDL